MGRGTQVCVSMRAKLKQSYLVKKNVNDINSLGLSGIGMQTGVLIPLSSEVVNLGVTSG